MVRPLPSMWRWWRRRRGPTSSNGGARRKLLARVLRCPVGSSIRCCSWAPFLWVCATLLRSHGWQRWSPCKQMCVALPPPPRTKGKTPTTCHSVVAGLISPLVWTGCSHIVGLWLACFIRLPHRCAHDHPSLAQVRPTHPPSPHGWGHRSKVKRNL